MTLDCKNERSPIDLFNKEKSASIFSYKEESEENRRSAIIFNI